jgi:hypothetical protein
MKRTTVGAAAFALVCAGLVPALAQTTQFMVAGAPVTVGAQQANSGKGYSIYHYKPVRNCASPLPNDQSTSVFSTMLTITSLGTMPQFFCKASHSSR